RARVLDARNHQANIRIAMIVGMTITNMMPSALSMIFAFAAPIGPCGSSTPPEQLLSERSRIGAADTRQGRGRRCKRNAAHDDMESSGCIFSEALLNWNYRKPAGTSTVVIQFVHVLPSTLLCGRGRHLSLGGDRWRADGEPINPFSRNQFIAAAGRSFFTSSSDGITLAP